MVPEETPGQHQPRAGPGGAAAPGQQRASGGDAPSTGLRRRRQAVLRRPGARCPEAEQDPGPGRVPGLVRRGRRPADQDDRGRGLRRHGAPGGPALPGRGVQRRGRPGDPARGGSGGGGGAGTHPGPRAQAVDAGPGEAGDVRSRRGRQAPRSARVPVGWLRRIRGGTRAERHTAAMAWGIPLFVAAAAGFPAGSIPSDLVPPPEGPPWVDSARPTDSPRTRRRSSRRSARFVDEKILPVATELEHADEYPTEIVEGLKELGIFGLMIPEEYDGLGESLLTYALCVEEIARGWMSVSGVINTHFIVAYMLMQHGTEEQKQKYLPRMATGEVRGAFSMSEPGLGSDVSAIKTKAVEDRRRLRDHRPEDVADQRRHLHPRRRAGEDRRGRRLGLPEHDDVPGGEGARLRRDRPGRHHPGQDRQDGLQGRRDHRDGLRGPPDLAPTRSSAASPARASTR